MRSNCRCKLHSGLMEHIVSLHAHYVAAISLRSLRNKNRQCNNTELYLIQDRKGGLQVGNGQNSTLQTNRIVLCNQQGRLRKCHDTNYISLKSSCRDSLGTRELGYLHVI